MLADAYRQIRIDTRRIDIFLHEREILPETLLEVHLDVIQREGHTAVGLCCVLGRGGDAVLLFVGYHVLDQFYGRITFAFIVTFAVLGSNHDILQSIDVGAHLDFHILAALSFAQSQHFRLIA